MSLPAGPNPSPNESISNESSSMATSPGTSTRPDMDLEYGGQEHPGSRIMKRITDEHRRKLKGVLGAFGLAAFAWLFVSDYLQQHNTVANTHQIQINTADITKIEKDRLKDLNTIKAYALQIDKIGAQIESDLESGQTTSAKVVIALCETMPACAVQLPNIMQSVVRH